MTLRELGIQLFKVRRCPGKCSQPATIYRIFGTFARIPCAGKQVLRINGKDGSLFWGCSRFPECRITSNF